MFEATSDAMPKPGGDGSAVFVKPNKEQGIIRYTTDGQPDNQSKPYSQPHWKSQNPKHKGCF